MFISYIAKNCIAIYPIHYRSDTERYCFRYTILFSLSWVIILTQLIINDPPNTLPPQALYVCNQKFSGNCNVAGGAPGGMFANSRRARAHSHGHAHDCRHGHAHGYYHGHKKNT